MKIRAVKFKFLLIALVLSAAGVQAQTYERSRTVAKSFAVSDETEIQVINKYGNIHMIPWEKDSVRFEISLSVKANKQSKADKTFDYIDFEFTATEYYVIAQTILQGKSNLWAEFSDLASNLFSGGTSTQINYTVYFPVNNQIKLENKFGNIYTTDHSARTEILLSNGDLKAHAFTGDSRITLEFGTANIDEIHSGKIFMKYGELNLEKCNFLDIESKSSKFYINSAGDVRIKSNRDRYNIREINSIDGESSFSFINIKSFSDNINLNTHYGELTLEKITASINFVSISSKYTDLYLTLDAEGYFEVEAIFNDKTEVKYPGSLLNKKESIVNEGEKIKKVVFKSGVMASDKAPINIKTNSGKLIFNDL